MLRIFVTGDNHIGLKYASHEQATVLASKRIEAFKNMVQAANSENCDLFVITGDLFENTYNISQKDIKKLMEILSGFRNIVAVLPGNHDYYDDSVKVWKDFKDVMACYDNIMLLTEYRPYELEVAEKPVILYPALCTSRHSEANQNNLGWIKETRFESEGTYHIGVAHGAVEGETIDKEGQYFLMKHSELENIPVDVWLIGHTHVPFPSNLTENFMTANKIFNAGTHVQTDVSCNTEGVCFIIEIDDNKVVLAKKFVSGNIRFYRKNISITAGEMKNILIRELDDIDDSSVVDIILLGTVSAQEYEDRNKIVTEFLDRFLEGTYNDYNLNKLISKELIESEFPEVSFSAKLLTSLLEEPKEAQLAYELLKSLKEGK